MSGTSYSKHPFNPLLSSSHLKEFTVLDVQLDHPSQRTNREITEEGNIVMGDVEVIRSDDFGVSNDTIIVRSHLCGVLEPGMLVMGYDLRRSALNNDEYEKYSDLLPDVVLVCRAKDPERKQQQNHNSLQYLYTVTRKKKSCKSKKQKSNANGDMEQSDSIPFSMYVWIDYILLSDRQMPFKLSKQTWIQYTWIYYHYYSILRNIHCLLIGIFNSI